MKRNMVRVLRNKMTRTNFQSTLDDILMNAMKINRAKLGNMQIINNENNWLEIVAHCGFTSSFLEHFSIVTADDGSICGRAIKLGETVLIHDVTSDENFSAHVQYAKDAGFRTVISTPLVSTRGSIIGVISIHFNLAHRFTKQELVRFEGYSSRAADKIEEFILFQ